MQLKTKVENGEFIVLAEMEPPKGADPAGMLENATRVRGVVDAFVVPEMSNAVMKMSSLGGSVLLSQNGMDSVMQLNCRDRNRLALQADLLGGYACGVSAVMAVKGVEPGHGDHHETRGVYDIGLMELLKAVGTLQRGRDMAGVELSGSPDFIVGSTLNILGTAVDDEVARMEEMTALGVEFFVTQPLFDMDSIEPFLKKIDTGRSMIIPTVLLLKSAGMARYMDRNMENIHIPGSIIERIQKSPDKPRACVSIAREMIASIKQEKFCGVMVSTIGWENRLPEILGVMDT